MQFSFKTTEWWIKFTNLSFLQINFHCLHAFYFNRVILSNMGTLKMQKSLEKQWLIYIWQFENLMRIHFKCGTSLYEMETVCTVGGGESDMMVGLEYWTWISQNLFKKTRENCLTPPVIVLVSKWNIVFLSSSFSKGLLSKPCCFNCVLKLKQQKVFGKNKQAWGKGKNRPAPLRRSLKVLLARHMTNVLQLIGRLTTCFVNSNAHIWTNLCQGHQVNLLKKHFPTLIGFRTILTLLPFVGGGGSASSPRWKHSLKCLSASYHTLRKCGT